MQRSAFLAVLAAAGAVALVVAVGALGGSTTAGTPLYPDIRTVVPKHLDIMNEHQRDILRFTNGIANTGAGDWRMRPETAVQEGQTVQNAVQEILDANGNVVEEHVVSTFEFHASHNHWHIGDVAEFEIRHAADDGTGGAFGEVAGTASIKVTFCLIDWYALEDNSPTTDRTYWDCYTSYQGISPGWVDQYHQSTEGQQLDITGVPEGIYYLISTANYNAAFVETDTTNNTAWQSFRLYRTTSGNAKLELIAHSACESRGMCGEKATNR